MSATSFKELIAHHHHSIAIMVYGDAENADNVAIECLDCNEVLLDFDKEE